jgi:hypothetical protein
MMLVRNTMESSTDGYSHTGVSGAEDAIDGVADVEQVCLRQATLGENVHIDPQDVLQLLGKSDQIEKVPILCHLNQEVEVEQFARLVIRKRMQLGLTQQELAKRMGTSHSVISLYRALKLKPHRMAERKTAFRDAKSDPVVTG